MKPLKPMRTAAFLAILATSAGCGGIIGPGLTASGDSSLSAKDYSAPSWAKNAVFYQIFPERFANGDKSNDPQGTMPWGSAPTNTNFMGGDLQGVIDHLDYLQKLGVTAIYLNPIFESPSNNKYNTTDYLKIDPEFGNLQTFQTLVADVHARGMKLILDGVFNHTGDTFWAFQQDKAQGPTSPYWNWYTIYGYPVVTSPQPNYLCWWGFGMLPKLNYSNPAVPNYILNTVVDYWTRQGIDGWRLDVPNEVTLQGFWQSFRQKVLSINPNAYIVGEIWTDPSPWVKGDMFDATMNYPFASDVLAFVNHQESASAFDSQLASERSGMGPATNNEFNIIDSHDTARFLTEAGTDPYRQREAALIQMTYPGAPVIYYGDEYGMQGQKDPDDRRCFDWNQADWNMTTWNWYQKLIAIRKSEPALRDGWFQTVDVDNQNNVYAYLREKQGNYDRILVVVNNQYSAQPITVPTANTDLANGTVLTDLLSGTKYTVQNGQVVLPGVDHGGVILSAGPAGT